MAPPSFPVVSGKTALGPHWLCTLDGEYARRVEDGCLVLWNSGLTIWLDQYGNDAGQTIGERLEMWHADISPDARAIKRGLDRFSYVLEEEDGIFSLNGFVFSETGHLLVQMSTDEESDIGRARKIFETIRAQN